MTTLTNRSGVAFAGHELVSRGSLRQVARTVKSLVDRGDPRSLLVFDASTSEPIELDLRGTVEDVLGRIRDEAVPDGEQVHAPGGDTPRSPGRPRLGVVAREVTLLPRHWEWLAKQPGGASGTLRRLVETARKAGAGEERRREARDAAYRFMGAMAGNEPAFEEACRALFAGTREAFEFHVSAWPAGVRDHATVLAGTWFGNGEAPPP